MKITRRPWALKLVPAALLATSAVSAHASSTRGTVISMTPIPNSAYCDLAIDDEAANRRLVFIAHPSVCEQRAQWVGKRALFHLSLTDIGEQLTPMATRVSAWPKEP